MRGGQLASAAEIVLRFIPAIKLFHIAPRSALERHQPELEAHERLPHSQISPRGLGKLYRRFRMLRASWLQDRQPTIG